MLFGGLCDPPPGVDWTLPGGSQTFGPVWTLTVTAVGWLCRVSCACSLLAWVAKNLTFCPYCVCGHSLTLRTCQALRPGKFLLTESFSVPLVSVFQTEDFKEQTLSLALFLPAHNPSLCCLCKIRITAWFSCFSLLSIPCWMLWVTLCPGSGLQARVLPASLVFKLIHWSHMMVHVTWCIFLH